MRLSMERKHIKFSAKKVATKSDGCGVVIGAPSEKNHLEINEIEIAKEILSEDLYSFLELGPKGRLR